MQPNGDGPSDETAKTEAPCHSVLRGTTKIPPCSKALKAEPGCSTALHQQY